MKDTKCSDRMGRKKKVKKRLSQTKLSSAAYIKDNKDGVAFEGICMRATKIK